jgi:hypothetical protein
MNNLNLSKSTKCNLKIWIIITSTSLNDANKRVRTINLLDTLCDMILILEKIIIIGAESTNL